MGKHPIIIQNAHTNNLKNISLEIPKNKFVVFTGVSGSGKSSLLSGELSVNRATQLLS